MRKIFDQIKSILTQDTSIIIIRKTKLDKSFTVSQFEIEVFSTVLFEAALASKLNSFTFPHDSEVCLIKINLKGNKLRIKMAHMIDFQNLTQIQSHSLMGQEELENEDMMKLLSALTEGLKSQLDLDFFQHDKNVQTKVKGTKYSNIKVKTKNLLTNVSYRRYKPEHAEKTNFVIDIFLFLTQNLNVNGLDRKLETPLERDYIKMICDSCEPHKFTKFIYLKESFIELSELHITSKSKQYCCKIC